MALLFCDGFDNCGTDASKWTGGVSSLSITTGRNGSGLTFPYTAYPGTPYKDLGVNAATIGVAFAYKKNAINTEDFFFMGDGGTTHLTIRQDGSGHWQVTRNGSVLGTSTQTYSQNTWAHVEIKATIHDTTGAVELRIDGVTVIALTNVDTRNGANAYVNRVGVLAHQGGGDGSPWVFDDFIVWDTSGSVNNDWFGDCKIVTLYPNGDGNSSQLVGSDGNSASNYLLVDEATPNGDTDYVESATPGEKDTYAFGNLSGGATDQIKAVVPNIYAKKSDAGARSVCTVTRLSGTEVDGATSVLPSGYTFFRDIHETKPGGGSWTPSDVNAAEFGMKVVA